MFTFRVHRCALTTDAATTGSSLLDLRNIGWRSTRRRSTMRLSQKEVEALLRHEIVSKQWTQ